MSEAQTQAAEVTSAAPAQAPITPDPATVKDATATAERPQAGRLIEKKPAPFRARTVGDALQRAQAAIAEQAKETKAEPAKDSVEAKPGEAVKAAEASGEQSKPAEAAKVDSSETKPSDEATKQAAKQERISRGLALIAEREQKVLAAEKRVKGMLAEIEQKQAASTDDPFVKLARQLKETQSSGGPAAVLKLLGIDLRAGVEELAKTYEDPTPESIARKVAVEEYERRQRESEEQTARAKAQVEEQKKAQEQVVRAEIVDDVTREFLRSADEFPYVIDHNVEAVQIADFALGEEKRTGRRPTAIEALRGVEKILFDAAEKARARQLAKAKAAEVTPPKASNASNSAPPSPKAEAKTEPTKQEAKPAEQPRRKESEVKPLVSRIQRRIGAHERARLAMQNLGLSK